jgi:type IX secretion system PorP/SprF family membrane protein
MIKTVLLIFSIVLSLQLNAQQLSQISQWNFHQFSINPAHAGIKPCMDIHALYRTQWVGFKGAPQTGIFTFSAPLKSKRKYYLSGRHGIGFKFENDRVGPFVHNRFNVAYARHMNFSTDNRLSMGLYGGIMQMSYLGNELSVIQPDPSVTRDVNLVLPDAHLGLWWNSKRYYVGLMLQNLVMLKWNKIGTNSGQQFHFALNGGYQFILSDKISLQPVALFKVPLKGPVAFDLNMLFDYKNQIGLGVGYRNTDALIFMASFKIKEQFSIHYSFDYTLSAIQNVSKNTHEVSLIFTGCKSKNTKTNACPMFE